MMSSLFGVPVDAAYYLVSALSSAFAPLLGGLGAAVAIIVFTMAVRLLVLPLSYYSFRGEKARAKLAPQIQELQRRHAHQPERFQRELSALYQAEGTGMFAGCLPALLQVPFFSVVYRLFRSGTIGGGRNRLLTHDLLGAPLGSHLFGGPGPFSAQGAVFALLFMLLGVVAVISVRAATQAGAALSGGAAQPGAAQAGRMMTALARFMPFGTVLMAAVLPLAAGLYLLTSTAWTVSERAVLRRRLTPPPAR
jgi:YidC/Oxa1 family membrane protein insertase